MTLILGFTLYWTCNYLPIKFQSVFVEMTALPITWNNFSINNSVQCGHCVYRHYLLNNWQTITKPKINHSNHETYCRHAGSITNQLPGLLKCTFWVRQLVNLKQFVNRPWMSQTECSTNQMLQYESISLCPCLCQGQCHFLEQETCFRRASAAGW